MREPLFLYALYSQKQEVLLKATKVPALNTEYRCLAELYTIHHPMTKQHYISFVAFVTSDRFRMVKFYPEGDAQTRLQLRGMGYLYYYCNQHGLFKKKI